LELPSSSFSKGRLRETKGKVFDCFIFAALIFYTHVMNLSDAYAQACRRKRENNVTGAEVEGKFNNVVLVKERKREIIIPQTQHDELKGTGRKLSVNTDLKCEIHGNVPL
jgi:hypothetical protein